MLVTNSDHQWSTSFGRRRALTAFEEAPNAWSLRAHRASLECVDGERAHAYSEAMRAPAELSVGTLDEAEQEVVREAADALLFCEDADANPAAELALAAFYELVLGSDRIGPETAAHLTASVLACGPVAAVAV